MRVSLHPLLNHQPQHVSSPCTEGHADSNLVRALRRNPLAPILRSAADRKDLPELRPFPCGTKALLAAHAAYPSHRHSITLS